MSWREKRERVWDEWQRMRERERAGKGVEEFRGNGKESHGGARHR